MPSSASCSKQDTEQGAQQICKRSSFIFKILHSTVSLAYFGSDFNIDKPKMDCYNNFILLKAMKERILFPKVKAESRRLVRVGKRMGNAVYGSGAGMFDR